MARRPTRRTSDAQDATATERVPYHEQVATALIEQLKAGTAPWQRPWKPGELSLPHNPVSGTRYRGGNVLWLQMQGRGDPRWMTYKQAASVGAQVRKGEHGTLIQYWKTTDREVVKGPDGKPLIRDGEKVYRVVELERPRSFTAVVFNAEQIDGLPALIQSPVDWDRHERAEALLQATGADIRHDQGDRAFYRPSTDRIHMPARGQFPDPDAYYATAFHEVGHWTGHASRLNRDLAHPFGSPGYAKEELRAEIASLMIGDELRIGHDPGQHASYVAHWVQALQDDPKEIIRAAKDADRIRDYLLAFERERAPEPAAVDPQSPGAPVVTAPFPAEVPIPAEAAPAFFDSAGTLRDAASGNVLPPDWQGIAKGENGYMYLGQRGGERSFTALAAETFPVAQREAETVRVLDVDVSHVLKDPAQSFANYRSFPGGDTLEQALAAHGITTIRDVTGHDPADFSARSSRVLSAVLPVFRIGPDPDAPLTSNLERQALSQAFATAAERLTHRQVDDPAKPETPAGGSRPVDGEAQEYRYALVNRPAGIGAVPAGFLRVDPRPENGTDHHEPSRHGVIVYSRPLTADQMRAFELRPLVDGLEREQLAREIAVDLEQYREKMLRYADEGKLALVRSSVGASFRRLHPENPSVGDFGTFVHQVVDHSRRLPAAVRSPDSPVPETPQGAPVEAGVAAKIREAFAAHGENGASPRVGHWYPVQVSDNGQSHNFLAIQKRAGLTNGTPAALTLINIRPGRLLEDSPVELVTHHYRLTQKNQLQEVSAPEATTETQRTLWVQSFASLPALPGPQPDSVSRPQPIAPQVPVIPPMPGGSAPAVPPDAVLQPLPEIPDSIRARLDQQLTQPLAVAAKIKELRDNPVLGTRYAAEYWSDNRPKVEASYQNMAEKLATIPNPDRLDAARRYLSERIPESYVTPAEADFFRDERSADLPRPAWADGPGHPATPQALTVLMTGIERSTFAAMPAEQGWTRANAGASLEVRHEATDSHLTLQRDGLCLSLKDGDFVARRFPIETTVRPADGTRIAAEISEVADGYLSQKARIQGRPDPYPDREHVNIVGSDAATTVAVFSHLREQGWRLDRDGNSLSREFPNMRHRASADAGTHDTLTAYRRNSELIVSHGDDVIAMCVPLARLARPEALRDLPADIEVYAAAYRTRQGLPAPGDQERPPAAPDMPADPRYTTAAGQALARALEARDLKAAVDVLHPLKLQEAQRAAVEAGLRVVVTRNKKEFFADIQSQLIRATRGPEKPSIPPIAPAPTTPPLGPEPPTRAPAQRPAASLQERRVASGRDR